MTTDDNVEVLKIASGNIILISDIHFGVNSASEEWQENIRDYFYSWFIPYVKKELATVPDAVLVCLGDVFHDRKSIDINVNNLCIDVFEDLAALLPVYIINGNHDLSKKTNKGNSSLRSLVNIPNLTVVQEPKLMKFTEGRKTLATIAAIPYLGDTNEENKQLVRFSGKAKYAFMHTDISHMKFDNGMTIVGAVDAEKFSGRVIAGHIHKRQETKKAMYVGSPYQLSRGDIGNTKGIYRLCLADDSLHFTENAYSPVFQRIDIADFMTMTPAERDNALNNNYTDIIVNESTLANYKMTDVYDILNTSKAKKAGVVVVKSKNEISAEGEDGESRIDQSIDELINEAIDQMVDLTDEFRAKMKEISDVYLKEAREELDAQQ